MSLFEFLGFRMKVGLNFWDFWISGIYGMKDEGGFEFLEFLGFLEGGFELSVYEDEDFDDEDELNVYEDEDVDDEIRI